MDSIEEWTDWRVARRTVVLALLALAVLILVSVSLLAATGNDGETRTSADGDNSYMADAEYVGSDRCADCHDDVRDTWMETPHAHAFAKATSGTVVGDFSTDPTLEVAPGVEVTLDLISNETGYYVDLDGTGTAVYKITHVQGAGKWLQVYLTARGETHYILPMAWANTLQTWVPFHTDQWYDATGAPKMASKSHVWDLQCVACHTVGAQVDYNETSGEWVASWEENGVACEDCHGPGSIHVSPPKGEERIDYIWKTTSSDLCGNCHVGASPVGKVGGMSPGYPLSADGRTIRPGDVHDDFFVLAPQLHPDGETAVGQANQYNDYLESHHFHTLTTIKEDEEGEDSCLQCHSTDYRLADEDERPTLETAKDDVECAACHDMHGTTEYANLRVDEWETCVQCHQNGDLGPGEEPMAPQKEVVLGEIPIDGLSGTPWMDGEVICVDCHMPDMGIRETAYDIPSHTFEFVSPQKSIDLGMPNSCTVSCHQGGTTGPSMTDEQALGHLEDWEEAIDALMEDADVAMMNASDAMARALDVGFTTAAVEAVNGSYVNARFAMEFIEEDASKAHNPTFQMKVLNYTIEKAGEVATALTPGRVQGFVKDGDGKAVQYAEVREGDVVWGTTSGDGGFDFDIAPGEHTFDVYKGKTKEKSFTVTVTAGDTVDAGTVKFKKDESGAFNMTLALAMLSLALVAVGMRRRRG